MSTDIPARPAASTRPGVVPATDLFQLGRQALAARRIHHGDRVSFVRSRQLLPSGGWRGPRDAAMAFVEEDDLAAVGGLDAAREAGVQALFVGRSTALAGQATAAGLEVYWRLHYASTADLPPDLRTAIPAGVVAVLPTPAADTFGLDTLRLFARCRLELGSTRISADFVRLGRNLAQLCLEFGADELFGPIVSERALRLGANAGNPALTRKEAAVLIRTAGFVPCERLGSGISGIMEEVTP